MRAQISTEFMFMVMFVMMLSLAFIAVFSAKYQENLQYKREILSLDYGYSLQKEFIIASEAKDGYSRTFTVFPKLEGLEYEVYINKTNLRLNFTGTKNPVVTDFIIPKTTGTIIKGDNVITKKNGTICLNC